MVKDIDFIVDCSKIHQKMIKPNSSLLSTNTHKSGIPEGLNHKNATGSRLGGKGEAKKNFKAALQCEPIDTKITSNTFEDQHIVRK